MYKYNCTMFVIMSCACSLVVRIAIMSFPESNGNGSVENPQHALNLELTPSPPPTSAHSSTNAANQTTDLFPTPSPVPQPGAGSIVSVPRMLASTAATTDGIAAGEAMPHPLNTTADVNSASHSSRLAQTPPSLFAQPVGPLRTGTSAEVIS